MKPTSDVTDEPSTVPQNVADVLVLPFEHQDSGIVLERILPYLTNRLAFKMNELLRQDLRRFGLRISEWRVLAVLAVNEGSTVNQLADYAMIEQSTLSRLIDRMIAAGLLIRSEGQQDGRIRSISLTPQGKEQFLAVRTLALAHTQRVLHGFTEQERDQLRQLVGRMTDNLNRPLELD